jgi:hypothetical protein
MKNSTINEALQGTFNVVENIFMVYLTTVAVSQDYIA